MRGFETGRYRYVAALLVASMAVLIDGCVTAVRPWGADATLRPGMQRLRDAAHDAATSPRVWVPLVGAALLQVNNWDRKVSDWARRETPLFGSQQNAADWSDRLRTASSVSYFTTVVLAPGADEPGEWLHYKAQGFLVGLGAISATGLATAELKSATGRTRPNGQGTLSFPSGHASHSAVTTGLARDNLPSFDLDDGSRRALDMGLDALSAATAWARVEAGAHFPADGLAGIALGNFLSRFVDESFLEPATGRGVAWALVPSQDGVELQWTLRY